MFSSDKVHCENCCKKEHANGKVSYYHQMMCAAIVHPNLKTVLPFCPEPIIKSDGISKNDCERNAAERLYRRIRREHPHLKLIVTEDALASNGPHIKLLKELKMNFIIVVTPNGNKSLFDFLQGVPRDEVIIKDESKTINIQFKNDIPLNDSHSDLNVNFVEIWVYDHEGKQLYHNSWVTDIHITKENVYQICRGGRAKWKIENEVFNTLKNQDYHFEHNFGHGYKHLSTVCACLMLLAFFIDQVQESCSNLFQVALKRAGSRKVLWSEIRECFKMFFIDSWLTFLEALAYGIKGYELVPLKQPPSYLDTS